MPNFNNNNSNGNNNYEKYYFTENDLIHIQQAGGVTNNGMKKTKDIKSEIIRESAHSLAFFVKIINNMKAHNNKNIGKVYSVAKILNKDYYLLQQKIKKAYTNKISKTTKPKKSDRKTYSLYPLCALILYIETATQQGEKIILPSLFLSEFNKIIRERVKIEWKMAKTKKEVELQTFMNYMDDEIIQKHYKDINFLKGRTVSNYLTIKNKTELEIDDKKWEKIKKKAKQVEDNMNNNNGITSAENILMGTILYVIPKFNKSKFNIENTRAITIALNKIKKFFKNNDNSNNNNNGASSYRKKKI